MATTEELEKEILAEMAADPVAYAAGPVNDVITIDGETRMISVPASEIFFGVESDKDVERKHFRCPKVVGDGIDLSKHQIYISYITSDSAGKTFSGNAGLYLCEDVATDGDDITFSWQLSGNVFASAGFIAFKVLAAKTDGENVQTRWNTVPAIGTVLMTVPDGMDIGEAYPDIVTQLLERMASVEKIATEEAMQGYVNTYLEAHPGEIDETLTDPKKAAPASVVGELKEDIDDYSEKIIGLNNQFPYPYNDADKIDNGITFKKIGRKLKIQGETTGVATFRFFGKYGATDNNPFKMGEAYYVSGLDAYTKLIFFNANGQEVLNLKGEIGKAIKFITPNSATGVAFYWQCTEIGNVINITLSPKIYTTDTSLANQVNDRSLSKNSIEIDDLIIDSSYESQHNIIDVPNNRIVKVNNDLTDYEGFGLPQLGKGTLLKYRPFNIEDKTTGFTVYDYTFLKNGTVSRWCAYAINNQTVDNLNWEKIPTFNELYNKGIDELGSKDLSIVFIGDSTVEGYGSSDYNGGATGTSGHLIPNDVKTWYRNTGNKCWVNKMINYLIETYPNVKACNNGIGGLNASQIYNNLSTLTLDDDGNRANVVILSVGTNDRYAKDKKAAISNYIIRIIDWLRSRQIQPIVLTNTPFLNGKKGNNPESIHRAIIDGCESAYCTCYPLLPTLKRYIWEHNISIAASSDQTKLLHDDLHPSDILYNIMFEIIKEILFI